MLRRRLLGRLVGIAAIGAVLGLAGESVHLHAGVWTLSSPGPPPIWIAVVYFGVLLGFGLALVALEPRLAPPLSVSTRAAFVESMFVVALFLAPPLLHTHEVLLAAMLVAWLVGRLAFVRAPGDLPLAGVAMALDLAVEGLLAGAGLYMYESAAYSPLPLWLPPLWGGLALSLRRLFRVVL